MLTLNVDAGLINPSHYEGGVPSKSDESPLKGDTPLLINQGFINPRSPLLPSGFVWVVVENRWRSLLERCFTIQGHSGKGFDLLRGLGSLVQN